jgi:hypothetical protein
MVERHAACGGIDMQHGLEAVAVHATALVAGGHAWQD